MRASYLGQGKVSVVRINRCPRRKRNCMSFSSEQTQLTVIFSGVHIKRLSVNWDSTISITTTTMTDNVAQSF